MEHDQEHRHDHHDRGRHGGHGRTPGAVDPSKATSELGIWTVKRSLFGLLITALLQLVVVPLSGSVELLSDTIHDSGDAATAVLVWLDFTLNRLGASRRFPCGYGRFEDLADVFVVLIILFSAMVAGYQPIEWLLNPEPIGLLWRRWRSPR